MKRFTETEKWRDPWFRALSPIHKCLWLYLCDNCDGAGVIEIDWGLAGYTIGQKVSISDLSEFSRQAEILANGKLWLRGFVRFQYSRLSADCKPHTQIFAALERHGITPDEAMAGVLKQEEGSLKGIHTLSIGYQGTLIDKDKEKDKEKDREETPLPFSSPAFIEAWSDWEKHLSEKRKPLKPTARRMQLKKLSGMGEARSVEALKHSTASNWTGIFEPDQRNTASNARTATTGRHFSDCNDYSKTGI